MSQSENGITPKPEFVDYEATETFQAIIKNSTPETCEIEIFGSDNRSITEHFNPELVIAADM